MKKTIYLLLAGALLGASCSREEMAAINRNPSVVEKPELQYLFTDALIGLQRGSYTDWFYDNTKYIMPWCQVLVGSPLTPNSANFNQPGATDDRFSVLYDQVGGPLARIRHLIDEEYNDYERPQYQYLRAMTYFVQIYYGIRVTDVMGSLPYKEAWQAFYTTPPLFTPVYDTQSELFTEWDAQLKNSIEVLSNPVMNGERQVDQILPDNHQDLIYGGDTERWIKLGNTLRLKLAVRLMDTDPGTALSIAEEVVSDGRLMSSIDDDFYWYGGEQNYNFEDAVYYGSGSRGLIDFMRRNKDPRLRFTFVKNDFNSMVVQKFLNEGKSLPDYIANNCQIEEVNGRPTFTGWTGDGEPWVRYYGAPVTVYGEIPQEEEAAYFRSTNFQITIGGSLRTYYPTSAFSTHIVQPNQTFTYPDTTDVSSQYLPNGNHPFRVALVTAAETQFYLAELTLRGMNGGGAAADYFSEGIRLSVASMNRGARDLNIPYYYEPYDKRYGKAIALQSGETEALLQQPDYMLTGDRATDLEKIYINLIIDHLLTPTDLYVTARRSGIPSSSSSLWQREPFSSGNLAIPRRFPVNEPSQANINYKNTVAAYAAQGFTMNSNVPEVLNQERIWYDKNGPDWGNPTF